MAVITTPPIQPVDQNGDPIPCLKPATNNNTTVLSVSGLGTSPVITTPIIRITASAAVQLEFGATPVGTSSLYLPSGAIEYFSFLPGNTVAALGTATVYITPMA